MIFQGIRFHISPITDWQVLRQPRRFPKPRAPWRSLVMNINIAGGGIQQLACANLIWYSSTIIPLISCALRCTCRVYCKSSNTFAVYTYSLHQIAQTKVLLQLLELFNKKHAAENAALGLEAWDFYRGFFFVRSFFTHSPCFA